jgi:hypothetical protein
MTPRVGAITFPGSLDDKDAGRSARLSGGRINSTLARGCRSTFLLMQLFHLVGFPMAVICVVVLLKSLHPLWKNFLSSY